MASIVDSFRNVFSEGTSLLKIVVLSVPMYYSFYLYYNSGQNYTNFYWVSGITLFFLIGILIKISNNVINEKNVVMPPFNPFTIAVTSIKGIVAIAIPASISYFVANYLSSLISINPGVDITLKILIWIVAASVIASSFLMFSANENIIEALNATAMFTKAGDMIASLIVFLLKLIVMNFFTICFAGYTIYLLFGISPFFSFFVIFAVVFNLVVTCDYFGQLHYEVMDIKLKKPKEKEGKTNSEW